MSDCDTFCEYFNCGKCEKYGENLKKCRMKDNQGKFERHIQCVIARKVRLIKEMSKKCMKLI